MASVTLSDIPPGLVHFDSMPAYPIEVYQGKTLLPVKDGTVKLPEGKHTLSLKNSKVFFAASVTVEITGGKTSAAKVNWPGLGSLTVQAEPSRCKIYVDGEFLDYPPINEHPIVAGSHKIKAILDSDPSQVQEKDITIEAGSPSCRHSRSILEIRDPWRRRGS